MSNLLTLFKLAGRRFANPGYLLTLACVTLATHELVTASSSYIMDTWTRATIWAAILTAICTLYVYYLPFGEVPQKKIDVLWYCVLFTWATILKWLNIAGRMPTTTEVGRSLINTLIYYVSALIGIIIGQFILYCLIILITRRVPKHITK